MTQQERQDLENKLAIYQRQKVKMESHIDRYDNLIEELQTQHEQNPRAEAIVEDLQDAITKRQAKIVEYERTLQIIVGINWLLES